MSTTIQEIKKENQAKLMTAVEKRVNELLEHDEMKAARAAIAELENNPVNYSFDECGDLVSSVDLRFDLLSEEEPEVLEALVETLSNGWFYIKQSQYSQGRHEWTATQFHGEPTIYNPNADRNTYALYSKELGLEVKRVKSERHAQLLVEQAMQEHGIFGDFVQVDYYGGYVKHVNCIGDKMTDAEIAAELEAIESED